MTTIELTQHVCIECGVFIPKVRAVRARESHQTPFYCSKTCSQKYNNRRLTRGAELYDAFIDAREGRTAAAKDEKAEAMKFAFWLLDEFLREDRATGDHRMRRPPVRKRPRVIHGIIMTGKGRRI